MDDATKISRTCSTTLDTAPHRVLSYIGNAWNLPAWAPAFAAQVRPGQDGSWFVQSGDAEREIVIRTALETGVVDFLSAYDGQLGAFLRVLPADAGSHVTFTLLFAGDTVLATLEEEMRSASEELANLRRVLG